VGSRRRRRHGSRLVAVIRAAILVGASTLLLSVTGSALWILGFDQVSVDIPLIVVLYLAFCDKRRLVGRGGGLAVTRTGELGSTEPSAQPSTIAAVVLLGYVTDVFAGGVRGVHALALACTYLVARIVAGRIFLASVLAQVGVVFVGAQALLAFVLLFRWGVGLAVVSPGVSVMLGHGLLTAAVAPLLMRVLRWADATGYGRRSQQDSRESDVRLGSVTGLRANWGHLLFDSRSRRRTRRRPL